MFVHRGASATTPYESAWQFQADNQILVGEGSPLQLNTASCGYRQFFNSVPASEYPVLTSETTAITLRNGAIVDHFRIEDAPVAIAADAAVTGTVNVNDVQLVGTGRTGDVGVQLTSLPANSKVKLLNMDLRSMDLGLYVDGGAGDVDFQGLITNTGSSLPSLLIDGTTGGTINVNRTLNTLETPTARSQSFVVSYGLVDGSSQAPAAVAIDFTTDTTVRVGQARITTPTQQGVAVAGNTRSEIEFLDLAVTNAVGQAFLTQANDSGSRVAISGSSSLSSASTTLAAFESNDAAVLDIELVSLESAVTQGTNAAIDLQGTSTGFFTIAEDFLVSGTPGTVAGDVTNATGVIVSVPAP